MILYCHPCKKIHLDFGDVLGVETGLVWSHDGDTCNVHSFEPGDFDALLAKKRETVGGCATVELRVGDPVERRIDMNPHGLV